MVRKVFYSFHFDKDAWRAGQVRNMGVVEGNKPVTDNTWEEVKKKGNSAIEEWIDEQLEGRTCTIVLIGAETAGRKWINHEINKSWKAGKGIFGIYIHNLKNSDGKQSKKGQNPFESVTIDGKKLSSFVKCYDLIHTDSIHTDSQKVYAYIKDNISDWVEKAIEDRKKK